MSVLQSKPRTAAARRAAAQPQESVVGTAAFLAHAKAAVLPLLAGYVAIAVLLGVVVATASGASFSFVGMLALGAPGWLAGAHVPLTLSGHVLGVMPLGLTLLQASLAARSTRTAIFNLKINHPFNAWPLMVTIAATHAAFGLLLALLLGDAASAAPGLALSNSALLGASGALIGVLRSPRMREIILERLNPLTYASVLALKGGLVGVLFTGTMLYLVGLFAHWSTALALFKTAGSFGSGLGLFLLCLGYLPNAIVATVFFCSGAGFSIGGAVISPLSVSTGALPAVPVIAPIPLHNSVLLTVVMLLPAVVGAWMGWLTRTTQPKAIDRVRSVGIAALTIGVLSMAAAQLIGGTLGGSLMGRVDVQAGLAGLCLTLLLGVPGAIVTWFMGTKPALDAPTTFLATPVVATPAEPPTQLVEQSVDSMSSRVQTRDDIESTGAYVPPFEHSVDLPVPSPASDEDFVDEFGPDFEDDDLFGEIETYDVDGYEHEDTNRPQA